ncbi:hypothetical protein GPECTOR_102g46 [Gonium pectorale]|uniref:tRNA-intron lyase n=1 Tax=Gonium pectorale TaxID=33097 RepID=A0A150FZP7_GONPE|nr:hypothetical protein GPECTOR_102g46 [Gonium pectorale]|eukprot:KXZ43093.1 hypothetical protein GPECTOR_102g46 [Gonium pectorale]
MLATLASLRLHALLQHGGVWLAVPPESAELLNQCCTGQMDGGPGTAEEVAAVLAPLVGEPAQLLPTLGTPSAQPMEAVVATTAGAPSPQPPQPPQRPADGLQPVDGLVPAAGGEQEPPRRPALEGGPANGDGDGDGDSLIQDADRGQGAATDGDLHAGGGVGPAGPQEPADAAVGPSAPDAADAVAGPGRPAGWMDGVGAGAGAGAGPGHSAAQHGYERLGAGADGGRGGRGRGRRGGGRGAPPPYCPAANGCRLVAVRLTPEETFFLHYVLRCLEVYELRPGAPLPATSEHVELLSSEALWRACIAIRSNFVTSYAAYHHLKAKGWIPRSGLLYGVDYVVYQLHPVGAHSDYGVLVLPVGPGGAPSGPHTPPLSWLDLQITNRLVNQVVKKLVLLYLYEQPGPDHSTPACLDNFAVCGRWTGAAQLERLSIDAASHAPILVTAPIPGPALAHAQVEERIVRRWVPDATRD